MSMTCVQEFASVDLVRAKQEAVIQEGFVQGANNMHLTQRELEVLRLVVYGHTAKRIGLMLKISNRTVEKYIENLKAKFKCHTKSSLAYICLNNDILRGEVFEKSA